MVERSPKSANLLSTTHLALVAIFVAISYVMLAEVGHSLSFKPAGFVTFWPPVGLLLPVLVLASRRQWPVLLAAGIAANLFSDVCLHEQRWSVAVGFALANVSSVTLGAFLLQAWFGVPFQLRRITNVLGFLILGAIGVTASATIGAATASHYFDKPYWSTWYLWWICDLLGLCVFGPTVILAAELSQENLRCSQRKLLEAAALTLLLIAGCYAAFGTERRIGTFYIFPGLIWLAMRFGRFGASLGVMIVSLSAILGFVTNRGVFGSTHETLHVMLPHLQFFVLVLVLTSQLFATAIFERRLAEARHSEKERLLRMLMEITTDAIFVKDTEGKYLLANQAVAKFVGRPVEQIEGHDDFELFDAATAAIFRQKDQDAIHAGEVRTYEETGVVQNEEKTFLATKGPLFSPTGELIGSVGISRDITEYRKTITALSDEERRLTTLTNLSPSGIFETDANGLCVFVNPRWCEFTGLTRDEAMGDGWAKALHPDDRERVFRAWHETAAKGERHFNLEYRYQTPAGKVSWVIGTAVPLLDDAGVIKGYIGNVVDVTQYHEAQESLLESEHRFRQMADAITEVFFLRQIEPFKFLYMSPAYETITGRSVQQVYDNPLDFLEAVHPDDRPALAHATLHPETIDKPLFFRIVRAEDDIRFIEVRISLIRNEAGNIILVAGVAMDISAQHNAEQALARKNEELEQRVAERTIELQDINDRLFAMNLKLQTEIHERSTIEQRLREQQSHLAQFSRLSTIGEMGAELAHEINQPLYAVQNYLTGVLHDLIPGAVVNESMIEALRAIETENSRAATIVRRIKNFVSRGEPQREKFSLAELCREVASLTEHETHMRRVTVEYRLPPDLGVCFGDPLQIEQVLVNLVRNAIDSLTEAEIAEPRVIVEAVRRKNCVEVAVHDNGPGLTTEAKARVFEPFYTTKHDGLGLGLAISKSIIEAHNGRVWVTNRYPSGASFYFEVPLAQGEAECPTTTTTASSS